MAREPQRRRFDVSGNWPSLREPALMSEAEWRAFVVEGFRSGEQRFDAQDEKLEKIEGLVEAFMALKVGASFLKWLGGVLLAGLALLGYIRGWPH